MSHKNDIQEYCTKKKKIQIYMNVYIELMKNYFYCNAFSMP